MKSNYKINIENLATVNYDIKITVIVQYNAIKNCLWQFWSIM